MHILWFSNVGTTVLPFVSRSLLSLKVATKYSVSLERTVRYVIKVKFSLNGIFVNDYFFLDFCTVAEVGTMNIYVHWNNESGREV